MHDPQGRRGPLQRDVVDKRTGEPKTLYLNVLAGAKPLLAEKVDETDKVSLGSLPGGLTVSRYTPCRASSAAGLPA